MAQNASNAVTQIGIIKETVFGTTPSTPQLISQKHSSGGFTVTREELLDDSKSSGRGYEQTQQGNSTIAGTISGPFTHTNYDTLLESVLFGTFTSNVLKRGETRVSLTMEDAQRDIGVFRSYTGMVGNSFTLTAPIDGLVTVDFEFMGMRETVATSSIDANGYSPSADKVPFTHCGGTILEGGAPVGVVNSISLTLTNNMNADFYWGSCSTGDIVPGRVDVTGTLDVFFTSAAMYNKFVNKTQSSLEFTLSNGTDTVTFKLPKIVYTGADLPIAAGSESRMLSLPFRALVDATEGTELIITRSA